MRGVRGVLHRQKENISVVGDSRSQTFLSFDDLDILEEYWPGILPDISNSTEMCLTFFSWSQGAIAEMGYQSHNSTSRARAQYDTLLRG